MSLKQGAFCLFLCLLVVFVACRRNQPSLIDRNEAPDTQLWYSPPDSTEYEYLVHMYWRGMDNDGTVTQYIWAIEDTLVLGQQAWNPADRLADLRSGRLISSTDSIFSFTAFKDFGGVGVKKNRQAFHIASIDDNGVIDPSPAVVEFVATIDQLPEIRFSVRRLAWYPAPNPNDPDTLGLIPGTPADPNPQPYQVLTTPADTVGMFVPFGVSYHGITTNGQIRGYRWRPLSTTVVLDSSDTWTEDISDTIRAFVNEGSERIPSSTFRFGAQCIDDADAESPVDAGQFRTGVAQIVVNFDPETTIDRVESSYTVNNVVFKRELSSADLEDAMPDTVSYASWLTLHYDGRDDDRDIKVCSPSDPNKCINFQIGYTRTSSRVRGSDALSGWLPRNGFHDTDPGSATDSNTVNIGSLEYQFQVRALDENERPDGTFATAAIIGNFDPTLDTYNIADQNSVPLNPSIIDTVTWDWWAPVDSSFGFDPNTGSPVFSKVFEWRIQGTGHDHPWEPDGSGVKAWRYFIYTDYGGPDETFRPLARAGETWVDGASLDVLDDVFRLTFNYPFSDYPKGDGVFANLPEYIGEDLTVILIGRDTEVGEPQFEQYVFLNGLKELVNSFPAASFGRYTGSATFAFHFRMVR